MKTQSALPLDSRL